MSSTPARRYASVRESRCMPEAVNEPRAVMVHKTGTTVHGGETSHLPSHRQAQQNHKVRVHRKHMTDIGRDFEMAVTQRRGTGVARRNSSPAMLGVVSASHHPNPPRPRHVRLLDGFCRASRRCDPSLLRKGAGLASRKLVGMRYSMPTPTRLAEYGPSCPLLACAGHVDSGGSGGRF